MKYIKRTAMLIAGLGLFLAGCSQSDTAKDQVKSDKIQAIATFYPMYEFTKEVLGDEGDVSLLIPAGTEPHDYEPSAKDMAKIAQSDVFVYNSQDLESWVTSAQKNLDPKHTLVIEAASTIALETEDDHESTDGHDHEHDPHVWTDPVLAVKEVEEIKTRLSAQYPEKKTIFEKNAEAYIDELEQLNTKYEEAFKGATHRTFVTQHAAFSYLAHQYDLTQESITGISAEQEPSPSRLAELKTYVKDHDVRVIYFEENASSKVAETLSTETGVELAVLNPLESLTQKQMDDGETYISIMEQNLEALKKSIY